MCLFIIRKQKTMDTFCMYRSNSVFWKLHCILFYGQMLNYLSSSPYIFICSASTVLLFTDGAAKGLLLW